MRYSTDPRPQLSARSSDSIHHAILLAESLLGPTPRAADSLSELKELVDRCREDIRQQNPRLGEYRLDALDQARSTLRYLREISQSDARVRLERVARGLRSAVRLEQIRRADRPV